MMGWLNNIISRNCMWLAFEIIENKIVMQLSVGFRHDPDDTLIDDALFVITKQTMNVLIAINNLT